MNAPVVLTPEAALHTAYRLAELETHNRELWRLVASHELTIAQQKARLAVLERGAAT